MDEALKGTHHDLRIAHGGNRVNFQQIHADVCCYGACDCRSPKRGELALSADVFDRNRDTIDACWARFWAHAVDFAEGKVMLRMAFVLIDVALLRYASDDLIRQGLRVLEIARRDSDIWSEATALGNLGAIFQNINPPKAIAYYEASLTLWRDVNDSRGICETLNRMGGGVFGVWRF